VSLIRSGTFWAGALVGATACWFWRRTTGPLAFTGGVTYEPKPLRRQGRLLRDKQARWNFTGGSSR
jgi:hypothetical protein